MFQAGGSAAASRALSCVEGPATSQPVPIAVTHALARRFAEQRRHPGVARVRLAEPRTDWNIAVIWPRDAFLSHAAKA